MSRGQLIAAFQQRPDARPAIVPLIGLHAAWLEQIEPNRFLSDPEAQARALRNAQALYETDAVTLGASLHVVAAAARAAAHGADDPVAGLADPAPLASPPDVEAVVRQPLVQVEREAISRLRPVLGERAGIAVVLPTPDRLQRQLAGSADRAWCLSLLLGVLRFLGSAEPDALLVIGEDDPGPRLAMVCDHFGMQRVILGRDLPPGVVATPGNRFTSVAAPSGADRAWLYTSIDEVPAETDPKEMRTAIARVRGS